MKISALFPAKNKTVSLNTPTKSPLKRRCRLLLPKSLKTQWSDAGGKPCRRSNKTRTNHSCSTESKAKQCLAKKRRNKFRRFHFITRYPYDPRGKHRFRCQIPHKGCRKSSRRRERPSSGYGTFFPVFPHSRKQTRSKSL